MVTVASPGRIPEAPAAPTAPAGSPVVANETFQQTAVDPNALRHSISQQAVIATIRNQDLVNYAYLEVMEKGGARTNTRRQNSKKCSE